MPELRSADAAVRNAPPILEVLQRELRDYEHVLEIGSGTGQHAIYFSASLPHLTWQTSELEQNHAGVRAWIAHAGGENVEPPMSLDVRTSSVESATFDAAFSANTAHIMSVDAGRRMFELVGIALREGGVFCLYGPFRIGGAFNTTSNERFDASLRQREPAMGIRDLEALDEFAARGGMRRMRLYAMPSNNYTAVWKKRETI
jgi:SAM-dependent methyltransferase